MGIFIGIIWVILAFVLASSAKNKGHSYGSFLILSLFLSPVMGFIALILMGNNKSIKPVIVKPGQKNIPSIDFENDKIEIEYNGHNSGITQRTVKVIGKEATNYGEYFIDCFCYLRNEKRTFRYSRIQKITINGLDYDIKKIIHLLPDMKWEFNIPVKMTYQNLDGDTNYHEKIINQIRIAQNGVFYVDKLSLHDEPVSFCTERIENLTINNIDISNPSKYFKDLYFKNKPIKVYLNQILVLLYVARIDNRFTQKEKDIFDNDTDSDGIIQLVCSENEY